MKAKRRFQKGFTLIELLVVITIIAALAGIVLTNFLGVRQRAKDAKKKAELNQLKSALRLYYNDNGKYPCSQDPSNPLNCPNNNSNSGIYIFGCGTFPPGVPTSCTTSLTANGVTYMKSIPDFNGSTGLAYGYNYCSAGNGDDFRIKVTLDNASDPDALTSQARCPIVCGIASSYAATDYLVCAD